MTQGIIPAVAVVIFNEEDPSLVLIVTHGPEAGHPTGIDGVPEGRLEEDETHIEAAIREVWQETDLQIKAEDLVEIGHIDRIEVERKDGGTLVGSCTGFLCKGYEGTIRSENGETTPKWIPINEVLREGHWLVNGTREVLGSALRERGRISRERER